jgi:hypothetical protein
MTSGFRAALAGSLVFLVVMLGHAAAGGSGLRQRANAAVVSVFPIPGDRVAAPQTQIAFRGIAPNMLGGIRVVGSSMACTLASWKRTPMDRARASFQAPRSRRARLSL